MGIPLPMQYTITFVCRILTESIHYTVYTLDTHPSSEPTGFTEDIISPPRVHPLLPFIGVIPSDSFFRSSISDWTRFPIPRGRLDLISEFLDLHAV